MRLLLLGIVLALLASNNLWAQKTISSPLQPGKEMPSDQLGLIAGIGPNWQSGTFYVLCDDCFFEGGTGFGTNFGLVYQKSINDYFKFGLIGQLDSRNIESSFREFEEFQFQNSVGQMEAIDIEHHHEAIVDFSYLSLVPYLSFTPRSWFYVRLGFSASFLSNSNVKHTKTLRQRTARLTTGEIVGISMSEGDGESAVVEDGEFTDAQATVLGIVPMIGFDFKLSNRWTLGPGYMHNIPISDTSTFGDNFRINSWRFFAELKFHLFKQ